jgi:hypothetical protein
MSSRWVLYVRSSCNGRVLTAVIQIATYLTWGLALTLETVTGSKHILYVPEADIQRGLQYFFIVLFTSYYANLLIKASVCVMLLRIMQERGWRIALWLMLGFLLAIAIADTTINTMACSPSSAYWTLAEHTSSCWSTEKLSVAAEILGGMFQLREEGRLMLR